MVGSIWISDRFFEKMIWDTWDTRDRWDTWDGWDSGRPAPKNPPDGSGLIKGVAEGPQRPLAVRTSLRCDGAVVGDVWGVWAEVGDG